jgi:hypothetical protein
MECTCTVAFDCCASDPIIDFNAATKLATEPITCDECRATQSSGKYTHVTGFDYDSKISHNICGDCTAVKNVFFDEGFVLGALWDELEMHIEETDGEIPEDCIKGLPKAARDRICDMLEANAMEDK